MEVTAERVNCRACNGGETSESILVNKGLILSKCGDCGTIFAHVRFIKEDLINVFYKNWMPSMFLRNDNESGNKTIARVKDAQFQLAILEKHKMVSGKMLDVGAACGTFLSVAKGRSWEITGTELSDACIEVAKERYDIELFKGETTEFKEKGFDVIVMWNTLEHLYEPYLEVKHLKTLLKDGGIMLLKIPLHTEKSIISQHMLPAHVFNFSEESIKYFFNQFDMEIIDKQIVKENEELSAMILVVKK